MLLPLDPQKIIVLRIYARGDPNEDSDIEVHIVTIDGYMRTLDDLYIDSRYPGELGLLPNGKPTIDDAWNFYQFAKSVFERATSLLEGN